jgi:hypothetical protein
MEGAMGRNLTLRLDEGVLRQAKHAAVEQDQSLSEWVSGLIAHALARRKRSQSAKESALKHMDRAPALGGFPLSREESHER